MSMDSETQTLIKRKGTVRRKLGRKRGKIKHADQTGVK